MRKLALVLAFASNACYATLQPHLAESTEVLAPGAASLTIAAGGGALADNCCRSIAAQYVGGLEARVRVGVSARQEVGVSVIGGGGSTVGGGDPPFALGGTLSYKFAPLRWLAFVASAGAVDMSSASVVVFSANLAVLVALYTAANGTQIYMGARGSVAVPLLRGAQAVNEALSLPIGIAIHSSEHLRIFVEGGALLGSGQFYNDYGSTPNAATTLGAYGLVAFTYIFR